LQRLPIDLVPRMEIHQIIATKRVDLGGIIYKIAKGFVALVISLQ